jgi:hypothetical protein
MTIGILAMRPLGVAIQCIGHKVANAIPERRDTLVPLYSAKDGTRRLWRKRIDTKSSFEAVT